MKLETYADRETLARSLADRIAVELVEALAQGQASLALPGGDTPAPLFEALSQAQIDWDRVTVMPGDERWVGTDDPRSNAGLIRRHLLQGPAAAATMLDLFTGDRVPESAEHKLTRMVRLHLPLSVLVLGMGADGHVASLFPRSPRLALALSDEAEPVMGMQAPGNEPRMSLTLGPLNGARHKHLLITGKDKRRVVEEAAGRDPMDMPVAALLDDLTVHWAA